MYPVASNFHSLSIKDAAKTRIRIYFIGDAVDCTDDNDVQTNGTLLVGAAGDTDSNGRIAQNGVIISERYNSEHNLTIGETASSAISITFLNSDGALNNFGFGRCKVYLDVYDDAGAAWLPCPMGVFRIEIPTRRKIQLIEASGFDQMQLFNAIADEWFSTLDFTSGLTIAQILSDMLTEVGVSLSSASSTSMLNSSVSFTEAPFDCVERTYRDILGWIAEATGTVARFDRDGALDMKPLVTPQISGQDIQIDTVTTGNTCLSIEAAEYTVSAIDALTIKLTDADQGVTVGTGDNAYTIMDNPLLYGDTVADIENKLTPIYTRLNGYGSYSPVSTRLIWDWSIEAGDIVYIVTSEGTYELPVFMQNMTWRGGYVVSDLISTGDPNRPQISSVERETYRMNREMATKVGDNEIISKINQSSEQITIQANKINLVGTVTANNGFVVNQDGTVEMNGATVNGIITVGGNNDADGILYIKDSNGNTCGRIDHNGLEVFQTELGRVNSMAVGGGYLVMTTGGTTAVLLNRSTDGAGSVNVYDKQGRRRAAVFGGTANVVVYDANNHIMGELAGDGTLSLLDAYQIKRFYLGMSGLFTVKDASGNVRYQLDSADGSVVSKDASEVTRSELNNSGLTIYDSNGTAIGSIVEVSGESVLTVDDATINGVLDVVPRRCYATLSDEGWYRVMKLTGSNIYEADGAGGFIADIKIVRNVDTANNEAHKISLMATWNNIKFINEQSVSNTLGITKIRTTNSGSNLYVDVYYGLSSTNTVTVAFNVTCRGGDEGKFNSQPFTSVAPSPSGETVVTEYTFAENTPFVSLLSSPIQAGGTQSIPNLGKYKGLEIVINTNSSNPGSSRGSVYMPLSSKDSRFFPIAIDTASSYIRLEFTGDTLTFVSSGISGLYIVAIYGIM